MSNFALFSQLAVEDYAQRFRSKGGITLFHHIPKTAGTSLVQELRFCFPPYFNVAAGARAPGDAPGDAPRDATRGDPIGDQIETFLTEHQDTQYRSASGHWRQPHVKRLREALPSARMFTFLRDPVARTISEFRYTRTPKHPTYQTYLKKYPTLADYVADPHEQNKMWHFLAQRAQTADAEGLEKVFRRYAFIGTVEDMTLCFEFFTALTGYPKTPSTRANVTESRRESDVEITPDLIAAIRAANAEDLALYDAVTARLTARKAEMQAFIDARRASYGGIDL